MEKQLEVHSVITEDQQNYAYVSAAHLLKNLRYDMLSYLEKNK